MISITCTNCQANLSIDDAFAGGVCRCQHCGTIQTVPAKGKANVQASPKPAAAVASKTLYQNKARVRQTTSTGTGLDDLANAVASSGLSDSSLTNKRPSSKPAARSAERTDRKKLLPILLLVAAVAVVAIGIVVAVLLSKGGHGTAPVQETGTGGTGTNLAGGANFCGIPLHAGSTIFLIDRGNSISNDFDTVKAVAFKAIDQLGPSRKFQVILWDNESGTAEFPAGQLGDATAGNLAELRKYFQDTVATGSSRLGGPLKEAVSRSPQEIVIATGKGSSDLDEDDAAVLRSMVGKNIRIDAVQIYPSAPSPNAVLQEVTRATGGQFKTVSTAELRDLLH